MFSQERDGRLSEMLGILGIFPQVGEVDVGMFPPAEGDDRLQFRIRLLVILYVPRKCLKNECECENESGKMFLQLERSLTLVS